MVQHTRRRGDSMPDCAGDITFEFDDAESSVPCPPLLDREAPTDLRIVTYNVLWDSIWNEPVRSGRILRALQPDVVAFQEIFQHDAEATAAWMAEELPGTWHAARGGADLVTVSRYPIIETWTPKTTCSVAHLIGLPWPGDSLALVVNLHLPWGTDDAGRQEAIDATMALVRDVMVPGNQPGVPEGTPILLTGDTNLLGDPQQVRTLLDGDIAANERFGPDFNPDWDGSSLREPVSRQPNRRLAYTTYNEASPYGPAHIDRFAYTGSVAGIATHFILHTPLMSDSLLLHHGLERDDTRVASDHLPHVGDFRLVPPATSAPYPSPTGLRIHPNPVRPGARVWVGPPETGRSVRLFDLAGRPVAQSDNGVSGVTELQAPANGGIYLCRIEDRRASLIVIPD